MQPLIEAISLSSTLPTLGGCYLTSLDHKEPSRFNISYRISNNVQKNWTHLHLISFWFDNFWKLLQNFPSKLRVPYLTCTLNCKKGDKIILHQECKDPQPQYYEAVDKYECGKWGLPCGTLLVGTLLENKISEEQLQLGFDLAVHKCQCKWAPGRLANKPDMPPANSSWYNF